MLQKRSDIYYLSLRLWQLVLFVPLLLTGCAGSNIDLSELSKALKPTSIERDDSVTECDRAWKGKTIFIDFDTSRSYWRYHYASNLAQSIKDTLIEDIVEDGCFHVQDRRSRQKYAYRVGVRIGSPFIKANNGAIKKISATFRIKTYDSRDNLITAKTRKVKYDAPIFTLTVNDSQEELIENYAHNVAVNIREAVYESLKSGKKYRTSAAVNFRSKPSSKGKIIKKLAKNTRVKPTGKKSGKWWQVKAGDKKGWIHSDYIKG